jgi:two-component system sensor histidine kinase and response regulator WspE
VDKLVSGGRLSTIRPGTSANNEKKHKRVLVVDDSLTVREVERKLLGNRGYEVEIAVDGMDGWNAVRTGHFNLIVTDIDMPRMDGFELVGMIKKDPVFKSLPVMIVSYKDREEDRMRGLEAGADYYLTKGSFHDETLLQAVVDLIGEPGS